MSWHLNGGAVIRRGLQSTGLIVVIGSFLLLHAGVASAASCTNSWKAAVSGNWNDSTKWSKGTVPTSSDNVCITAANGSTAYTVALDGSQGGEFANSLSVGPATGTATLLMEGQGGEDDASLSVTGAITTTTTGTIEETNATGTGATAAPQDVNLSWSGAFANAGKVVTLSGVAGGTRELDGSISNTGTVTIDTNTNDDTGSTTFSNAGAVTAGLGANFLFDGGSQIWTQGAAGTITSSGGGTIDMTNSATFNQGAGAAGQVVLESSSTLHLGGAGAGTFVFHDSDSLSGNVGAAQSLVIQGVGCDHDSSLTSSAGFTNAGSIDLTNVEGSCTQSQSATLDWSGTLTNSGKITSDFGVSGGDRELDGFLTNTGSVTINSDTSFDANEIGAVFDNKKTVTVANGATLSTNGGQTFNDDTGGSINTTSGALDFSNTIFEVGAGSVGTTPVLLQNSSSLELKGAGAGTFDFEGSNTLSGNVGAAQSLLLQGVGCGTGSTVTAATDFTNAGSIDLTNVRDGCTASSQPAILQWSGTLTNTGTITSDFGTAGGDRELDGNLTNSGSVTINTDTGLDAASSLFDNKKTVTIAAGATLATSADDGQTFKNDTGGSIADAAPGGLDFLNTIFDVGAGAVGSTPILLQNSSTLSIGGAAPGTFDLEGSDTLSVPAGKTVAGQAIVLQGTGCGIGNVSVTSPSGFTNGGSIDLTNVRNPCANSADASLSWSGTITNTGTITSDFGVAGGTRELGGNLTNDGNLNINANTSFDNGSGTVLANAGTLLLAAGRKLSLPDGETFRQTAAGTLDEQIASATSFGKLLDPSGPVTLGGTLQVDTLNSYAPPGGTKFQFITFNTRVGLFATTTFNGHSYQVKYDPNDVTLIAQDPTTTTVTTSASSVPEGAPVTVTATVQGPAAPSPTGTVSFTASGSGTFNPSTANCTLASSGTGVSKCSVTYTPSALGNQTFTANYPGDSAHLSSSGTSSSVSVTTRSTTTAISCSPVSVAVGASSSCKATVTDSSAGTKSTPSGSVAFHSDSSGSFSATSCTLTAGTTGTASCSVSYTPSAVGSGTHNITGTFTPDGTDTVHSGSMGSTALTVTARTTSTSVSCTPNPVASGSATSCTATVTDTSPGAKTAPTGSVTFVASGSGSFDTSTCTLGNATATAASCSVNYTPSASGGQTITALYSGDATHKSSSNTFSLSVT